MISVFLALVFIIIIATIVGTMVFLLDGWVTWGFGTVLLGIGTVILWSLFAWAFIAALALVAMVIAGAVMSGGSE